MTTTQGDDDTDSQTTKLVIDGTEISPSEASKMANEFAIIHNESIRQEQTQKFQSKYTTREPILKPTLDRFVLHPILNTQTCGTCTSKHKQVIGLLKN